MESTKLNMVFDVYYEFLSLKKREIVKKYIGKMSGVSFQNACENFARENEDFAKYFNSAELTYKNWELVADLL